jgi:hypothetical protein
MDIVDLAPVAFIARQKVSGFSLVLSQDGRIGIKGPQPPATLVEYIKAHRPGIISALQAEADKLRADLRTALDAGNCDPLSLKTREALAAIAEGKGPDSPQQVRCLLEYLREAKL